MLGVTIGLVLPFFSLYLLSVLLGQALRTYSRSLLEELCEARGHADRAEDVYRHDERTERGAEALSFVTGLGLAALLGASTQWFHTPLEIEAMLAVALILGGAGHVAAGVIGRVHAEDVLDRLWPIARVLRATMRPFTAIARAIEGIAYRRARRSFHTHRPASVEVEIHSSNDAEEEDIEADLSESTREILERVVELSRRDVSEIMIPASSMVSISANFSVEEAAKTFVETGRSRIPLYGENRDDIVGILFVKDLTPRLLDASGTGESIRAIARKPSFVPETKSAAELLEQFQAERIQMAIVVDEYGSVAGLITLEDLIEQIVGPIDDEHDVPTPTHSIVDLGDRRYDVDATVDIEELNDELGLHLPTNESETVGGFAFSTLGRLPEPNESFRYNGVEFTVLDVTDRSIRRLRLNLQPQPVGATPGNPER